MLLLGLKIYLFSCLSSFLEASSTHLPRMTFTDKESAMTTLPLHFSPLKILMEAGTDVVTAVGGTRINTFNFDTQQIVERPVEWEECIRSGAQQSDCNYNITVAQMMKGNDMFVCGSNGQETLCCNMNTEETPAKCVPSDNMQKIRESIRDFVPKGHEQSALVGSTGEDEFYITVSGSQDYVGIHKFGRHRVRPANHDKEQHYVGLLVNRQEDDPGQDKVYAFYKEKNKDPRLDSKMWLPFVTRVCMSDVGGPKNNMQFSWTSQMNARLFCGDAVNRRHFSELVDVATVQAENWTDTRVYALFRNEWGMSAVCVYTMQEIDQTFKTSHFKGSDKQDERPRTCVKDSLRISFDILRMIKTTSEMEDWVQPVDGSGPLHISHHNYTHISVDKIRNSHTVLFLSLHNGGVHKVMRSKNQSIVIAEYRPFSQRTDIHSITLNPSSRKLYVSSRGQLVQMDVTNCAQYGDTCKDCVLARDPYCSWNRKQCTSDTQGAWQDVEHGNNGICSSFSKSPELIDETITLPRKAKYFLRCPITSHHAQYTWQHPESTTSCSSKEQQCLLVIDRMDHKQVGTYSCVSEEMGHVKVLAKYRLQLKSRAGSWSSGMSVWLCLVAALLVLR